MKLVGDMHTYEMDPAKIVEDTERTRSGLQTDGRTDNMIPIYPFNFNFVGGECLCVCVCVLGGGGGGGGGTGGGGTPLGEYSTI